MTYRRRTRIVAILLLISVVLIMTLGMDIVSGQLVTDVFWDRNYPRYF